MLLIVETLSLMLCESEIFASRTASLKTDDGAVVSQLITVLVKRPVIHDHVTGVEQVLVSTCQSFPGQFVMIVLSYRSTKLTDLHAVSFSSLKCSHLCEIENEKQLILRTS